MAALRLPARRDGRGCALARERAHSLRGKRGQRRRALGCIDEIQNLSPSRARPRRATPMKNPRFCRRTLLRSLGIGAGFLPLLNAERAPAQSANGYPTRLITITWTNGVVPSAFYPPAGPITAALPALLSPLEAYKDKILALRATDRERSPIDLQVMIDVDQTFNGHQSYPALLTGT